jgi:lipopolysaccharide/colanic/teichoic acid biosynthesis glycosyltransferase
MIRKEEGSMTPGYSLETAREREEIYAQPGSTRSESPSENWRYAYLKRAFDITCATLMVAAFALPGVLIALAVVLTSRGPVFYREQRVGRRGRPFRIWKFRSMWEHAPCHSQIEDKTRGSKVLQWRMIKSLKDPRITPVGGFLRRWSLDELPQLFNVLRGEMSLIGPRPIVEAEVKLFGDAIDAYMEVLPGLSGLWQVSGRCNIDYAHRAQLDRKYVRDWSLRSDMSIFWQTIPAVLSRIGAH